MLLLGNRVWLAKRPDGKWSSVVEQQISAKEAGKERPLVAAVTSVMFEADLTILPTRF